MRIHTMISFIPVCYIMKRLGHDCHAFCHGSNGSGCLEECQGRLGGDEGLERHELLWVVGCESFDALLKLMEV